MKQNTNQSQNVLELVAQKGLLRPSDLDQIKIPRIILTRMTASEQLEKVSRGLYRLPSSQTSEYERLLTVATTTPQAVLCLLCALQCTRSPHNVPVKYEAPCRAAATHLH